LIDWMSLYGAFWRDRFDRLEALLNRMDSGSRAALGHPTLRGSQVRSGLTAGGE
jgi:hypothetical protein